MGNIKLKLFNRTKYEQNLKKLQARKAPIYIIEAYNRGLIGVVNEYYKIRLHKKRNLAESADNKNLMKLKEFVKKAELKMLDEAFNKKDFDFLNLMYKMTNIDILTKHRKIPANAGQLIKQGEILDLGLTKLHKKLR